MRVDATIGTVVLIALAHAVVLIPGAPVSLRAAVTLAYAIAAGWLFVSIFGLGASRPLDRLIYGVATSITALMLVGLAANMILPYLGVERPLQAATALMILDILAISGMIFLFRSKYLQPTSTRVRENAKKESKDNLTNTIPWTSAVVWGACAIPPILAAIGANILNAGGSALVSAAAIVCVVALLAGALFFRNKTSDTTAAWLLFCAALTLLWIGWLRSNYVSGVDIAVEYHLFEQTLNAGRWSIEIYRDSYNACMSITILPTLLTALTGLPPETIFKMVIPTVFALVPVATFLFLRRYVATSYALLGGIFVLSQHAFLLWWTIPIKQEVGLFLFGTLLLIISDRDLNNRTRFVSVLVIGLGLVVAHYTTTYVALTLLVGAGVLSLLYALITKTKSGRKIFSALRIYTPMQQARASIRSLTIPLGAVLMILFATVAWYGIITETEGSTVASVRQVFTSLESILDDDVRQAGALTSVFNPLGTLPSEASLLADVATEIEKQATAPGRYPPETYEDFRIQAVPENNPPVSVPNIVKQGAFGLNELAKTIIKIFLLLGVWILLSKHLKRGDIEIEVVILTLLAFGILAAMLFLPFASIVYSVSRAYQQVAAVVALAFALGVGAFISLCERYKVQTLGWTAIIGLVMIPILFYTGLASMLVGGTSLTTMFANEGRNYDEVYVDRGEVLAAEWVFKNTEINDIYAASRARHKMWISEGFTLGRTAENVFPQSIHRDGYVYADSTNTIKGIGYVASAGTTLAYYYPLDFLAQQKDIVYSTATATIYR